MYNGIGLPSARGSGTNAHVQRNLSNLKPKPSREEKKPEMTSKRKPNADLAKHEQKREIELRCLELRTDLEEEGLDKKLIDKKVKQLREQLANPKPLVSNSDHDARLARAFGVRRSISPNDDRDKRSRSRSPESQRK